MSLRFQRLTVCNIGQSWIASLVKPINYIWTQNRINHGIEINKNDWVEQRLWLTGTNVVRCHLHFYRFIDFWSAFREHKQLFTLLQKLSDAFYDNLITTYLINCGMALANKCICLYRFSVVPVMISCLNATIWKTDFDWARFIISL